jgi:hypothetical protein
VPPPSDATVLIHGESGVGKNAAAEYIHALSLRAGSRLVTIRCVALPDSLLESELFGDTYHTAIGGTVVIDGIAELPLRFQGIAARHAGARRSRPRQFRFTADRLCASSQRRTANFLSWWPRVSFVRTC